MESSLYHKQEGSVDTERETHTHCCGCWTALVGHQQRRRTERGLGREGQGATLMWHRGTATRHLGSREFG